MGRDEFLLWLQNSPLKSKDQLFMIDEKELTYKELAQKYNLTESGIYQRKRRLYEQLHRYEYYLMDKKFL